MKAKGLRSYGVADAKAGGAQAVPLYTAQAGGDGPPLRHKYLSHSVKSNKAKAGGNSGKTGRKYRRKARAGGYLTRSYTRAGRLSA